MPTIKIIREQESAEGTTFGAHPLTDTMPNQTASSTFQPGFLKALLESSISTATPNTPTNCDDSDQGHGNQPAATLGSRHAETIEGGPGLDNLVGLNGDDTLIGLQGKDWLYGDNGMDLLDGGEGRDFLYGGNGDDELRGGKGRDDLFGENGNDLLIGGCGPDLMDGGRGNDILFGGNASDIFTGGPGSDVFTLALPGGNGGHGDNKNMESLIIPLVHEDEEGDVITDFRQGVDYLALSGSLTFSQLLFEGDRIYVGMDKETGSDEHDDQGRLLAKLTGFDTTRLRNLWATGA